VLTDDDLRIAFHDYKDAIYQFAWHMTNSSSAAEDILQEVFLTALRDRKRFEPGRGELRFFLLGIARNLALNRFRNEKRWTILDETEFVSSPVEWDGFDAAGALAAAVQQLPPLQREVLILSTYEELPLSEIAQLTGAEVGAVKARLHRARESLKRMLAPLKPSLNGSSRTWNR
jgi:RNA polymerase sigma-70 factor, ECF subfamily